MTVLQKNFYAETPLSTIKIHGQYNYMLSLSLTRAHTHTRGRVHAHTVHSQSQVLVHLCTVASETKFAAISPCILSSALVNAL